MKRLTYIWWSCPLALALNTLPLLLPGMWSLVLASLAALALWAVVWLRLYANRRLRPEFAVLAVLPQMVQHGFAFAGGLPPELNTLLWQNLFFASWCAVAWVNIRALLLGPGEERAAGRHDAVLIFMSIITLCFCFSSWVNAAPRLFPGITTPYSYHQPYTHHEHTPRPPHPRGAHPALLRQPR